MRRVDPYAILGVSAMAGEKEVSAAYRKQAKRWHPDRGGGEEAQRRMAEINAAYDVLRSGEWQHHRSGKGPDHQQPAAGRARRRGPRGAWLPDAVRAALGSELLRALEDHEGVQLVTPAATWASPRTLLAVTDRRLLWLLDDVVSDRVRELRLRSIAYADSRLSWPRRRTAVLRVR